MKNFNVKNKDNKISHGRGNSLRNEVKGWVELGSPNDLVNYWPKKTLRQNLSRPGSENTERIASLNSNSQVLTEPVSLPGLPCRLDKAVAYRSQDDSSGPTIHSHRFDCNWLKLMGLCESSVFTALI